MKVEPKSTDNMFSKYAYNPIQAIQEKKESPVNTNFGISNCDN
jgi:hypothetical protein